MKYFAHTNNRYTFIINFGPSGKASIDASPASLWVLGIT